MDSTLAEFEQKNQKKQSGEDRKASNYANFEQEIARELYNRRDVREAGQKALSRVSTLLIRYNRLKSAEARSSQSVRDKIDEIRARYDEKEEKLKEAEAAAKLLKDEEARSKELEKIEKGRQSNQEHYQISMSEAYSQGQKDLKEDLITQTDEDKSGGILSTLMLGGEAEGSKGYSLTTGDTNDLTKGTDYIRDAAGEKGTLFEQMSLLDNAMNTGGIELPGSGGQADAWYGPSVKGASSSLNDILHNITEQDVNNMNAFANGEMEVQMNLGAINRAKEQGTLDSMIGKSQEKLSVGEALEQRGVTDEMISRKQGKTGGVNDLDAKQKKQIASYANPKKMGRNGFMGFFRHFGSEPKYTGLDEMGNEDEKSLSRQEQKRRATRRARIAWQKQMQQAQMMRLSNSQEVPELNKNDTAESSLSMLDPKQTEAVKQIEDSGFLRTMKQNLKQNTEDNQDENPNMAAEQAQDENALGELSEDKSARNMLAAYRLMGATQQELFQFRLALIAYMVPAGKKTIYEILKESEEAGVKGNEDLSDPETMYATFLEEGPRMDKKKPENSTEEADQLSFKFGKRGDERKDRKTGQNRMPGKRKLLDTIPEASEQRENVVEEAAEEEEDDDLEMDSFEPLLSDVQPGIDKEIPANYNGEAKKGSINGLGERKAKRLNWQGAGGLEKIEEAEAAREDGIVSVDELFVNRERKRASGTGTGFRLLAGGKQEKVPDEWENIDKNQEEEPKINSIGLEEFLGEDLEEEGNEEQNQVEEVNEVQNQAEEPKTNTMTLEEFLGEEQAEEVIEGQNQAEEPKTNTMTLEEILGEDLEEENQVEEGNKEAQVLQEQVPEAKAEQQVQEGDQQEIKPANDLMAANEGAKAVNGLNFQPVTRERISWRAKLKNRLWRGLKMAVGVLAMPITAAVAGVTRIYQAATQGRKLEGAQANRIENRPVIAGRDNRLLSEITPKEENGEEKVYDNIQNVPLVWERVTAGDPEAQPELTVMVEQSVTGSDMAMEGKNMGHTMLGLTYSRKSQLTGRKERYKLQYGFYPKGGFTGMNATVAMAGGAIMPGMLQDDYGHKYSIARTYAIDTKKVNEVLRESEQYPNGGYGYYKRNCTTFVVDMARKAGLSIGNELQEEEMQFDANNGALINMSNAFQYGGRYMTGAALETKLQKNDLSYANFGQKMATLEDRDRYYDTTQVFSGSKEGFSPGVAGEHLRASEGGGGLSANFTDVDVDQLTAKSLDSVFVSTMETHELLKKGIEALIPADQRTEKDAEFLMKLMSLDALNQFSEKIKQKNITTAEIRELHKSITDWQQELNSYYQVRLMQSTELNENFMKIMNQIEPMLMYLDKIYNEKVYDDYEGDLKHARFTFEKGEANMFYPAKEGDENEGGYSADNISPSLYEGYLQIYGSAEKAIPAIANYQKLLKEYSEAKTDEEKKEARRKLSYPERIHETAQQFAASHKYRLNKRQYDENDMKYAFEELPDMEKLPSIELEYQNIMYLQNLTPSSMYQAEIFAPVFEGFAGAAKEVNSDSFEDDARKVSEQLTQLAGRPESRVQLEQILSYYIRSQGQGKSAENIWDSFYTTFQKSYLSQIFLSFSRFEELQEWGKYIKENSSFKTFILGVINSLLVAQE